MQKLYEIFKVLKIQKIIVSAETIRGNTVNQMYYAYLVSDYSRGKRSEYGKT